MAHNHDVAGSSHAPAIILHADEAVACVPLLSAPSFLKGESWKLIEHWKHLKQQNILF